jgi:hypothetical protein
MRMSLTSGLRRGKRPRRNLLLGTGILLVSVISLLFPAATFAARAQTTASRAGGIAPWKLAGASVS